MPTLRRFERRVFAAVVLVGCSNPSDPDPQAAAPTPPAVTDVGVVPTHARPGDVLTCHHTFVPAGTDDDRSVVRWLVDGVEVGTGSTLDTSALAVGVDVFCEVTPNDGRAAGTPVSARATLPGNYLIFVADDLGVDRLSAYGVGENFPHTPRIDALAAQGVRFTRAWEEALCSPGRAALQTGRQPYQTGIGHALPKQSDNPLADTEVTLAEMLTGGTGGLYATSMVGKWHLTSSTLGEGYYTNPNDQGWQHFAGILMGLDGEGFDKKPQSYYSWEKTVNGVPSRSSLYVTIDNAKEAVERIDTMAEPWILLVAFYAPHGPIDGPPIELTSGIEVGSSPVQVKTNQMIEALDNQLGVVMDALTPDVAARTTVFFTGDNGTSSEAISAPYDPERAKASPWEGGLRVPLIVSGLHVARAGETCDNLVHLADLYATLADLSRIDTDDGVERDTVSFAPSLVDAEAPPPRTHAFSEAFQPPGAPPYSQHWIALRDERYKLVRTTLLGDFFYDLGSDWVEGEDLLAAGLNAEQQAAYDALMAAVPVEFP